MNKILFLLFLLFFVLSVVLLYSKPPVQPAPVSAADKAAETRKKDSIAYLDLVKSSNSYTFQETPNEVLLSNGMKIKFLKMTRFPIPRGVAVNIPDDISQRFQYELGEIEIQATNTTSAEIKIDPSEAVFVSLRLYSPDNAWKSYTSQYALSMGSVYLKTEPAQPDRSKNTYNESFEFFNKSYKPGQTKTCKGMIVAIAKNAKVDRIVLTTKEFGQNISYGCPAKI